MSTQEYDLIIVGNGATATAVAFALQQRAKELKIALVGPGRRPGSATAAAGAMLNVFGEIEDGLLDHALFRHKFELARRASLLWPSWLESVRTAATNSDVDLNLGTYIVNNAKGDEQDGATFRSIIRALRQCDEPFELVDPASIAMYAPDVVGRGYEALYIPREGTIDPRKLFAVYDACWKNGNVHPIDGTAHAVAIGPGDNKAVELTNGLRLRAPKVLLAAGAMTREIVATIQELANTVLPVFYGTGAALLLNTKIDGPQKVVRTPNRAFACGLHLVPLGKRQVYIGASNSVSATPQARPSITSLHFLMEGAMEQFNTLFYNAELEHTFLGHRPVSADTLPMIGETSVAGLFVLTGTRRDGFHNSPIYAADMADRIVGRSGFIDAGFLPERKIVRWLDRDRAMAMSVRQIQSAGFQHGLRMPRSNWQPMIEDMLRRDVENIYQRSGVTYGIPPELLNLYRDGHLTDLH